MLTNYSEVPPTAPLRRFVECYWIARGAGTSHEVLPDGCIDFLFECGDRPRAWVVGAMTAPLTATPPEGSDFVAIRFRPGGAHPFVRASLADLTDGGVALDDLPAPHRQLRDRVFDAPTIPARLQAIEAWLLSRAPERSDAIDMALATLQASAGSMRIDELARASGVSRQWLSRGIRERAGLSPKLLARILRLRSLERAASSGTPLAQLALRFGFHDQAHLARDVRAIHRRTTKSWLGFHSSKTEPGGDGNVGA